MSKEFKLAFIIKLNILLTPKSAPMIKEKMAFILPLSQGLIGISKLSEFLPNMESISMEGLHFSSELLSC